MHTILCNIDCYSGVVHPSWKIQLLLLTSLPTASNCSRPSLSFSPSSTMPSGPRLANLKRAHLLLGAPLFQVQSCNTQRHLVLTQTLPTIKMQGNIVENYVRRIDSLISQLNTIFYCMPDNKLIHITLIKGYYSVLGPTLSPTIVGNLPVLPCPPNTT
jgi:hypothetical protein